MFNPILDMFLNMPKQAIKINGVDSDGIINEIKDREVGKDAKYLFALKDVVSQGDIIEYQGVKYIVILKEQPIQNVYDRCIIQAVNYKLNFIIDGIVQSVDAIIKVDGVSFDWDAFISIVDGRIRVIIPHTMGIMEGNRVIALRNTWLCTMVDTSNDGLMALTFAKDTIRAADDMVNEIPDTDTIITPEPEPDPPAEGYTIVLVGDATINQYATKVYTATVSDSTGVVSKACTFTLSNTNAEIVEVTDSTVKLKGLIKGDLILTATMVEDAMVSANLPIKVVSMF